MDNSEHIWFVDLMLLLSAWAMLLLSGNLQMTT